MHFSVSSVGTLHIEPSSGNCFTYLSLDRVPIPQETLQGDHVIQSDIMQVEPSKIQRTVSIADIYTITCPPTSKSTAVHLCAVTSPLPLASHLLCCSLYSSPSHFCVLRAPAQLNCRAHHRLYAFVFFCSYSCFCYNSVRTATNTF